MNLELIKQRNSVYLMAAILVTVLAVFMNKTETSSAITLAVPDHIEPKAKPVAEESVVAAKHTASLAASLIDTHHGVQLKSRNNNLIVTASLKDLFDYYLSAAGEESTTEIDQRIQNELANQLQGAALAQALSIWKNYLSYKTELVMFDQQYVSFSNQSGKLKQLQLLQQRQLALIALQDQILGADVAEILFKFDRQLDGHTLEKAELLASDLSPEQKQQRLINLSAQLPIDTVLSAQRNEQQKALLEINRTALSAQQKYQQREQQVGSAAATRLQLLDEKRAEWKNRLANFKHKKRQLKQAGLASEEYNEGLEKLYRLHFAPDEQLRARALTESHE